MLESLQLWVSGMGLPAMLAIGLMTLVAFYAGRSMKYIGMPSIIGFMLVGVILGPSVFDVLTDNLRGDLGFITHIALGFVALSIGLELSLRSLMRQGPGILILIVLESVMAFIVVFVAVWLLTGDLAYALIFGAIAPASAPAGTVAVIQEYKARGDMTRALYAVVGFDDGLGIIIFGFAAAFARNIMAHRAEVEAATSTLAMIGIPLLEIAASLIVGGIIALVFCLLLRRQDSSQGVLIQTFAIVLITAGICQRFNLSLILTHMVLGLVMVNTQPPKLLERVRQQLTDVLPLLFVLFFALAGANLHVAELRHLGLLGLVYVLARSGGKISGAWLGSVLGKLPDTFRRYLGMGILSQAGVAIGLALIVKSDFADYGPLGEAFGATVLTTITATCIFFEIIGPYLTKIALTRAGEIPADAPRNPASSAH